MRKGLHIIANFFGCKNNAELLVCGTKIEKEAARIIQGQDLMILKKHFHQFEGAGVTGFILLAESHFSIHTWPERNNYIALDIFVCNYQGDNSPKAKAILQEFVDLFKPTKLEKKLIRRL